MTAAPPLSTAAGAAPEGPPPPEPRFRLLGRMSPVAWWSSRGAAADWVFISLLVIMTLVAVAAPWLAPHDPVQPVGAPRQPWFSDGHLLGTDMLGRDLLSRTLMGLRTSWLLAMIVTVVGLIIGMTVGLVAGMHGGWVDTVLMRFTEVFLALPSMIVAVAVAAALGPGLTNTFIAVTIVWWPYYARIIRSEVRALAVRPHVEAARMAGVGWFRIMWRHLLPGTVPTAIVTASLDIGNVVLVLATLSFLGLGQPAPAPELGADTSRGMAEILNAWWVPVIPGACVALLSLISNLAGDGVRNRLANRS
ncbi:ABC transporter permease [Nesterenkonia sp. NBAIMH1]|uniref:ABC transporter permease n=1 Tax=Nesterenkonia sp. NBAIMH1 TaxID=2600320 RepID=UPI001AEF7F70|nr:ABC transporter permease [Nesterenkonia sp. NBAIMH1]